MSDPSRTYAIHSDEECDRLERQAVIADYQSHLKRLNIPEGAHVLDAGCGSASMARLIARTNANATVVGIDVRQKYIDFARAKAATDGLQNIQFQRGDVFSLPFADGTFDVVWTKYLMQWLNEPKKALAEFKRVT